MEPEGLKAEFGDRLAFHGGIDTQWLLPGGSPQDVRKETRRFIDILYKGGGYILAPSQGFQTDVPIENVEAMYAAAD
jgi:uroporphyrinogen decarboxylase